MYATLHHILIPFYTLLPIAGLIWSISWGRYKRSIVPFASFLVTCLSGVILGTCVDVLFVAILHGSLLPAEIARTWYFIISVLCTVSLFRWFVRSATFRLFRVDPRRVSNLWARSRLVLASALQLILLFGLGLPYVVGTLLVHRIQITHSDTPKSVAQCVSDAVTFKSTDNLTLSAWWIEADCSSSRPNKDSIAKTVIMCGGLSDDLPDQAGLLRILVNDGYNVLFLNLRGHEHSDGRWTSFGDLERRDVLGAVRWLKAVHPHDSRHIKALGVGIGGAAVIGAATDESDEGQSIDAVAVIGSYARFQSLAEQLFTSRLPAPFRKWVTSVTLPIASAHAGTDLANFAPADMVQKLWPRPLLIIEGRADRVFPPGEADELFRQATYPKRAVWVDAGHTDSLKNADAARALLDFFDRLHPRPAI